MIEKLACSVAGAALAVSGSLRLGSRGRPSERRPALASHSDRERTRARRAASPQSSPIPHVNVDEFKAGVVWIVRWLVPVRKVEVWTRCRVRLVMAASVESACRCPVRTRKLGRRLSRSMSIVALKLPEKAQSITRTSSKLIRSGHRDKKNRSFELSIILPDKTQKQFIFSVACVMQYFLVRTVRNVNACTKDRLRLVMSLANIRLAFKCVLIQSMHFAAVALATHTALPSPTLLISPLITAIMAGKY
ncbi:hypothetical protein ACJJTC_005851 [Scirpophaga incertulas]